MQRIAIGVFEEAFLKRNSSINPSSADLRKAIEDGGSDYHAVGVILRCCRVIHVLPVGPNAYILNASLLYACTSNTFVDRRFSEYKAFFLPLAFNYNALRVFFRRGELHLERPYETISDFQLCLVLYHYQRDGHR